jgi:small-conductance mechanosensitive channel
MKQQIGAATGGLSEGNGAGSVRMANELRTEVEHVKEREDVKRALKQTSTVKPDEKPKAQAKDKLLLGTHITILIVLSLVRFVLSFQVFGFAARFIPLIQKLNLGVMAIVLLLAVSKTVDVYLIGRIDSPVSRYNLKRVARLVLGLMITFAVVTILFQNWYTAVVSLGLISLILGFALQTPITSFIGWIYILARTPYRVGDRIKIGDATGDVIDVSYLDTTLWEFGGDILSTDHPTGRVIKFPNSKVLSTPVYNYSWPVFPYIWNEIKFSVGYETDLEFVADTMQRIAAEEVGERMMKQVRVFRELLAQTPVDQLEVREHPAVIFRVNANTWLDAILRYLVHPKEAGRVKSRLIKRLLTELNAAPDRVLFPKGNAR